MINKDKYSGCFMGLAIGDVYGAPYEGGFAEQLLWKVIGKTPQGKMRYTDDTQMSMDLAHSFLHYKDIDQQHLAMTFAHSYRWSRGYGTGAAWLLKKIKQGEGWQTVNRAKFKLGSFGNGAAMRAPIVTLCRPHNEMELRRYVVKCSEITHAHPLAIEGAQLIAMVTFAALHNWHTEAVLKAMPTWCNSPEYQTKIAYCTDAILSSKTKQPLKHYKVKKHLGNGIAAAQSCVTAIYFALHYRNNDHHAMLTEICKLGGDTDTIAAMSGAIWGAFNGYESLDRKKAQHIENKEKILYLSTQLYQHSFT